MQKTRSKKKIVPTLAMAGAGAAAMLFFLLENPLFKTTNQQTFEHEIRKLENTLFDQVNTPAKGAPFFSIQTLNPIWPNPLDSQTPIVTIPKLELIDQTNTKRDENLFKSHITILGFFFASCSGFCPFLIESMKLIESKINDDPRFQNVRFVAITVNPEKDNPKVLSHYMEQHGLGPRWTLLTGSKKTIFDLAKVTLASQLKKRQASEDNFIHSEHLYVIDHDKNLRGILNGTRIKVKTAAVKVLSELAELQ